MKIKKTDRGELEEILEDIRSESAGEEAGRYLMKDDGSIPGTVESIVYRNESNGYTVVTFNSEGTVISAFGIMPEIGEGDRLSLFGNWETSARFGRQLRVGEYRVEAPLEKADIEKYLASGAIKGIGPKTAARIADAFGEDTADVIENHPEYLAQIPGITPKRAREISEEFKSKSDVRTVMAFFRSFFGPSLTMRIYDRYGEKSVETAKRSPYTLCDEIDGLSFEAADSMALKLGFDVASPDRISSGIRWTLNRVLFREGHTCLPEDRLIGAASSALSVAPEEIRPCLEREIGAGRLVSETLSADAGEDPSGAEEKLIYPAEIYDHERYIAGRLVRLCRGSMPVSLDDIERFIGISERRNGLVYAEEQRSAIRSALSKGVLVLTGGPGTGKTTVISALISIFENLGMDYTLAAPTGRAAKRITESTGREAKTIHRLLEVDFSSGEPNDDRDLLRKFKRNEKNRLDEDAVIVDELSMIDVLLMSALLHALKPGCRLILIGDADQLPSVGPGNVLHDMISSGVIPSVALSKVFRQAESSLIVTNAHLINRGEMPCLTARDRDFFFIPRESDEEIASLTAELVASRLPAAYGDGESVQAITPSRRGVCGTENLNRRIREALNPPAPWKREHRRGDTLFRCGDRVMQVRNNYEICWRTGGRTGQGLFNGETGVIESIDPSGLFIEINFDGKTVDYSFSDLDDLEPAFAVTVHKSQGSEFDSVVIPLGTVPPVLATRNLIYTAVTRAHRRVVIVGRAGVLAEMIANKTVSDRFTGLRRRLIEASAQSSGFSSGRANPF